MHVREALSMFLKPVLIVEDMPFFAKMAEDCLRREYVEITFAKNGKEAISFSKEKKYDLILMDLYMPECDGDIACKEIRADSKNRSTPIIMMTISDKNDDIARCKQAGCDDFIKKPFNRIELVNKVKTLTNLPSWSGDRYQIKSKIKFSDNNMDFIEGNLHDISIGGLLIETNKLLNIGTNINVGFKLDNEGSTIKAKGKVVWHNTKSNTKKGDFSGMGIEFTEIMKLDLLAIQSWINNNNST